MIQFLNETATKSDKERLQRNQPSKRVRGMDLVMVRGDELCKMSCTAEGAKYWSVGFHRTCYTPNTQAIPQYATYPLNPIHREKNMTSILPPG